MGGNDYCSVYGCDHSRSKQIKPCGYYEFPKQPQAKTHWIAATGRKDINCKTISKFAKVCGCHFLSGKPNRTDRNNVDYVPTLQIPTSVSKTTPRPSRTSAKTTEWTEAVNSAEQLHRKAAAIPRKSRRRLNIDEIPTVGNEVEIVEEIDTEKLADVEIGGVPEDQIVFDGDHNYTHRRVLELEPTNNSSAECQTDKTECHDSASQTADDSDFLRVKVKQYEHYIAKLKAQLKEKEKSVMAFNHHMIKDDKSALFWTGLPNKGVFMALYGFFEPKAKNLKFSRTVGGGAPRYSHSASSKRKTGKENKISLIDELFATLVRLKVGLLVPDISQRLGISTGHFSKMFEKWIQFLRNELSQLTRFPSLQEMRQYLPEQFHQYPNTRVIIDCTEIFCQKPSSLKSQRQLWSNYKHHNTYKALVGISPDGTVVFVSNLYGGSCSDKFITKDCGILDHLEPGDSVMADRGFLIEDLLGEGVSLNLPPFRDSKDSQLSAKQVEETRRIAAVRIHVERAIQRIKVFHILDGVMPLSLHHNAEDIFKVCAYLTNFQTPIIA